MVIPGGTNYDYEYYSIKLESDHLGIPVSLYIENLKGKILKGQETGIRIKIDNEKFELIPGSLLEVTIKFNQRDSLSVPDTSIMLEGNKVYVYKVIENNNIEKKEVRIGVRNEGLVEVLSGLDEGDTIVAAGLKKVNPKGKIKPISK